MRNSQPGGGVASDHNVTIGRQDWSSEGMQINHCAIADYSSNMPQVASMYQIPTHSFVRCGHAGRLLGAGMSSCPEHNELGLSSEPSAMGHGVCSTATARQEPPWHASAWRSWVGRLMPGSDSWPGLLELGPPWSKWPDFSRTMNVNALLQGLWPSTAAAVEREVRHQVYEWDGEHRASSCRGPALLDE
jgi:hypothetical protein